MRVVQELEVDGKDPLLDLEVIVFRFLYLLPNDSSGVGSDSQRRFSVE